MDADLRRLSRSFPTTDLEERDAHFVRLARGEGLERASEALREAVGAEAESRTRMRLWLPLPGEVPCGRVFNDPEKPLHLLGRSHYASGEVVQTARCRSSTTSEIIDPLWRWGRPSCRNCQNIWAAICGRARRLSGQDRYQERAVLRLRHELAVFTGREVRCFDDVLAGQPSLFGGGA